MAQAVQKITLSPSRDIPFEKLVLSQSNVPRLKAGISVEKLAENIARHGFLQNLNVKPVLGKNGAETGQFEIPAGGRRFQTLSMLVKQKSLVKTAPINCIVRDPNSTILVKDDPLKQKMQLVALHPLDQLQAFADMAKRQGEKTIAAAFFVSPAVVMQRLRLVSVAHALLKVYADDGMTLEHLIAFTISNDHTRQVQI